MKGDLRCINGRLMRHDPQPDDPDLETDVGECDNCEVACEGPVNLLRSLRREE